jgi:hypothetical protein
MIWTLSLLLLASGIGQAGDSTWQAITTEGVVRASAAVDSVYLDRRIPGTTVSGGDFAAYLMARLGTRRFPPDFGFRVQVDSSQIRIGGRVADLPPEARNALGPLVMVLAPDTWLEGQVQLLSAGPQAVRFHLKGATIGGIAVPEQVLASTMESVGTGYPALTKTGRDLFVQVPTGATMRLGDGGVVLRGP